MEHLFDRLQFFEYILQNHMQYHNKEQGGNAKTWQRKTHRAEFMDVHTNSGAKYVW